tara:strand:- start:42 stop:761 length:720 start_codon:yes stop_codon:yes gene_type:complete
MNLSANFRGASHTADTVVDLYFDAVSGSSGSGAYDKIPLTITTQKEQEVMEYIGGALAGTHSKGMVVIADDVASKYVNANITAVGTITRSALGNRRLVEAITNGSATTRTLTVEETGKLFQIDMTTVDNNVTLTLPTASTAAGVYYDFTYQANCDDGADFAITTGADGTDFYGGIIAGGANSTIQDVNGDASLLTIDGSAAQTTEGLRMTVLCDGTNWLLSGYNQTVVGTAQIVLSATA